MLDLNLAQAVARDAAIQAGDWLKQNQQKVMVLKSKADQLDLQTTADIEAEKLIFAVIEKSFPDHNLFSEEKGLVDKKSPFTWVVDPLDGTKEYVRNQSDFLSLVALQDKNEVLTGCVYNPSTKETYTGAKNLGGFKLQQHLSASKESDIKKSFIYYRLSKQPHDQKLHGRVVEVLSKLLPAAYRVRGSTYDVMSICYVAQGAAEGLVILPGLGVNWWDVAPGIVVANEAGAKITNAYGRPFKNQVMNDGLVITNGLIHEQLLDIINQ
ncbi:MAG TPA: inositol monophosphatase [Patescibacteria group bacterium]|nr:inositol monophosphatase [Patescibacteria group bacterium]